MATGRSEFVSNGGHAVCLRDGDITAIRGDVANVKVDVADLKKRMFVDNGHDSIQTSLATGAARFKAIYENMQTMKEQITGLSAHVTSLADVIRQNNTLQNGLAGESLTIEGLTRQVLKQMPCGTTGSVAPWVSLAIISVCITIVFLKAW